MFEIFLFIKTESYKFKKVYHTNFWPLEWTVAHKPNNICYAKLICNKTDKVILYSTIWLLIN